MTAAEHNKTLATLWYIYGAMHGLTVVGLLLMVFVAKLATPLAELIATSWIVGGIMVVAILFLLVGLLPVLVGQGLRKKSRWVRPLAIALAVISLLNIPVGTALGIYTLKFFKSQGGVSLYGGRESVISETELQGALHDAQPLADLAKRVRR
jgi:4-amino-4-deoxy-L-arabinose transferase-like glycosyltransferase